MIQIFSLPKATAMIPLAQSLNSNFIILLMSLGSLCLWSCYKPESIELNPDFTVMRGLMTNQSPQSLPPHVDSPSGQALNEDSNSTGANQAWLSKNINNISHLNRPSLFLGTCIFIDQIYWGPTKLADFQLDDFYNSKTNAGSSHLIPLPTPMTQQTLWLHVFRSPRTGFQPDCLQLSISSDSVALSRFLSFQLIETMTGILLLFLCLLSTVTYIFNKQINIVFFAITAMITGGFLLTSSHLFAFAFANISWMLYLPTFLSLLIPSAILNLLHHILPKKLPLLRILALLNLLPFFICGLLYWQNLIQEYYFLKIWTQACFYPQFVLAWILTKRGLSQSASPLKIKVEGLYILLIGTTLDFASLLFFKPSYLGTCVAAFIFFGFLLSYVTQIFVNREQQLEILKSTNLKEFNDKLVITVSQRSNTIKEKTTELELSNQELARKNILLKISYKRMEDLIGQKNELLKRAAEIDHFNLPRVAEGLEKLRIDHSKSMIHNLSIKFHKIISQLEPVASLHRQVEALMGRILWVVDPTQQLLFATKAALGGSGASIRAFTNAEEVLGELSTQKPDLAIISSDIASLSVILHQQMPQVALMLTSQVEISQHIELLSEHPSICHILYQDEQDPIFTQKNIFVTAAKILSNDVFGLEKYLNWGVDVKEFIITSSADRAFFLEAMKTDLAKAGIQSSHIRNATLIADELLMNAIYDAPIDRKSGQSKYNHLSRRVVIDLGPKEYGKLRFAFDGTTIAISVDDPFGALQRDTIIRYLKSCFDGRFGSINVAEGKGGGGMGLFQIISTAHLMITNIKPHEKTEIIALIHTASRVQARRQHNSFHYFVERA